MMKRKCFANHKTSFHTMHFDEVNTENSRGWGVGGTARLARRVAARPPPGGVVFAGLQHATLSCRTHSGCDWKRSQALAAGFSCPCLQGSQKVAWRNLPCFALCRLSSGSLSFQEVALVLELHWNGNTLWMEWGVLLCGQNPVTFPVCYADVKSLGGAVQRLSSSPPIHRLWEPLQLIDPTCHLDALPGLGHRLHTTPSCELDSRHVVGRDT